MLHQPYPSLDSDRFSSLAPAPRRKQRVRVMAVPLCPARPEAERRRSPSPPRLARLTGLSPAREPSCAAGAHRSPSRPRWHRPKSLVAPSLPGRRWCPFRVPPRDERWALNQVPRTWPAEPGRLTPTVSGPAGRTAWPGEPVLLTPTARESAGPGRSAESRAGRARWPQSFAGRAGHSPRDGRLTPHSAAPPPAPRSVARGRVCRSCAAGLPRRAEPSEPGQAGR